MLTVLPLAVFAAFSCAAPLETVGQEKERPASGQQNAYDATHAAWTRILGKHLRGDR